MPEELEKTNRSSFEKFCDIDLDNTTTEEISTQFFGKFINTLKRGRKLERDNEILYILVTDEFIPPNYTDEDIYKEILKKTISPEQELSDEETLEYIKKNHDPLIGGPLQDKLTISLVNLLPKRTRSLIYKDTNSYEELRENLSNFLKSISINYEYSLLDSGYPYQELQTVKNYYIKEFKEILNEEIHSSKDSKESFETDPRKFIRNFINTL
jgi:hypothetical protein